ncbi:MULTISPECIES: hypothetical protein [unclassified Bradyrhizobium]
MTVRKRITFDTMAPARAAKVKAINDYFDRLVSEQSHRDRAHALKREWAKSDLDKLQPEADLRGISKEELADIILAKPNTSAVAERELQRQKMMLAIDAATTPAELEAIKP